MPLPWHGTKEVPDLSKQPKNCSWGWSATEQSVWCQCFHRQVICGPRHGILCPGWLGRGSPRRKNWLCSSPAVWSDILLRLWLDYLMLKNPSAATTVMRIPVPTIRDGTCPLDAIQCCLVPLPLQCRSHATLSCFPPGSCKVLEEAQYTTQGRKLGRRGADDQRVTYMRGMLGSHSAGSSESLYRPQQPAPSRCPHGSALGRSAGQRSSQLTHYRL